MKYIKLKKIIKSLESGGREKGGSISCGIPSLGAQHLDNDGKLKLRDMKFVSVAYYENMNKGKIEKNDILIVKDGATTGKVSFVDSDFPYEKSAINEHVFRITLKERYLPKYVFWYLFSQRGQSEILKDFRGATVGGISTKFVDNVEIPDFSLETQKKIVEVLDKTQGLIDARKEQIRLMDELIQSVFYEMFGDPVTNPKGWEKNTIGSVIQSITAGWSVNGEARNRNEDEKAVLKVSAVTQGYFKEDEYKVINKSQEIKKYVFPEKGDLLFSRANTREMVGATCVIEKDYPNLLLPDKLWKVLFNKKADVYYMKYILTHPSVRAEFSAMSTGTSGSMYNVSMDKFKNIVIPVPTIKMQNQFSQFVKLMIKNKIEMNESINEIQLCYHSLMQKLFKGELFGGL